MLAVFLAAATGCRDERPKPPTVGEAMPNLPLPPQSAVLGREGSTDALAITFISSWSPDSMADYYRGMLTHGEWTLVSDTRDRKGVIALYAERSGPPLWVRIWRDSTVNGSLVTLAGAVPPADSTADTATAAAVPDTGAK